MNRYAKRLIDVVGAGCGLVLFSVPMVGIFLAIRGTMGSPAVFLQRRPGLRGRPFTMAKFRTMSDRRDADGRLLHDSQRLTPLGRFLRRTSLDELPELFNVLAGTMSLVGPRPLLVDYLELYTPEQARRHDVKPGITGWAQVNGRQNVTFSRRFELDVWYVDHGTLLLDLKILLLTLSKVFRTEGVKSGQDVMDVDDVGFTAAMAARASAMRSREG